MKHTLKFIGCLFMLLAIVTVAYAADQAINARTELAAAPETDDIIPIYDTSATAGKRITITNLFGFLATPPAIGGTTPAAGTFTTLNAGGTGFSVDADGDTTAKSFSVNKADGVAGSMWVYEGNSTDDNIAGFQGAANQTESYLWKFPNAKPAPSAGDYVIYGAAAQSSGAGTKADPYIHAITEITLNDDAGNGDTTSLWSADKVFDQLALKMPLAGGTFSDSVTLADGKSIKTETDSSDDWSSWQATDDVGGTPAQVDVIKVTNSGTSDSTTLELGGLNIKTKIYINAAADAMADDNWNGTAIRGRNCGENLSQWDLVRLANDADPWHQADANAAGEFPAIGLSVAACTDGNEAIVLTHGVVRNEGWTGLTPGGKVYLSTTAGGLTQTAPSTSGDCVQVVGFALSDSEIYFDFSRPYLEVE